MYKYTIAAAISRAKQHGGNYEKAIHGMGKTHQRHIFGYADTLAAATFLAQTCETNGVYGIINIDDGDETVAFVER